MGESVQNRRGRRQPHRVNISQALALLLLAGAAGSGQAQSPSNHPSTVSQTIRGVTVQLTDLQWSPFDPPNSPVPFFKEFYLSYRVFDTRLSQPLPTQKSLLDDITAITAVSPDGRLLPNPGSGMVRNRDGATVSRYSYWENVDPRWPLVAVDVDFIDPAAPLRASGRFAGPVTITGIPVPVESDKITPVHAEATTVLGTKIVVEKVKVSPGAKEYQTTFVFRVVPAPDAPDLQFIFSSGGKVIDDTGARVNPTGVGIAGGGDLLEPQLPYQSQTRSVGVAGVPSAGAKTLTLTLDVNESSEQLKEDHWFRHFHLLVPMRLLDPSGRRPYSSLAAVEGKQVAATLESLTPQQSRYRTRFTFQDRTHSGLTWRLDAVRGKDDAGNPLTSSPTGTAFFWKADGSPLAKNEDSEEVVLGAPGEPNGPFGVAAPKPAKTLALEADVSAVREQYHVLDFPKIPIPAPGQFRVLNRAVQDASGARLILRKIGAYSPDAPLPGLNFSDLSKPPYYLSPPPTGIAVVLAEPPDPKGKTDFDFTVVAANDPFRRHLGREDGLTEVSAPGDLVGPGPSISPNVPARVRTFFFRAASLGAATFNLRMGYDAVIHLNRHETLVFPAVAAPEIK